MCCSLGTSKPIITSIKSLPPIPTRMKHLGWLLLAFAFSGCSRAEGKSTSDVLQYLLHQDGWIAWPVCLVLVFVLFNLLRIFRFGLRLALRSIRQGYRFTFGWGRRHLVFIALLGTLMWVGRDWLISGLQEIEQRYLHPVYVNEYGSLSAEHVTAIYEAELAKQIDPYQKEIVTRRTREIAEKIKSTPLAIYQCAHLECGLDPFTVRRDRVAAGWIQFTRAGISGLRQNGQPIAYEAVLQACAAKDAGFIMNLTETYLTFQYERAKRRPLDNTIDLYLALFAPALIGAEYDKVVYEGYDNPRYYKNDGLDGWYVADAPNGQKQIFHKDAAKDGNITILEMFLALESKKNKLLGLYLK